MIDDLTFKDFQLLLRLLDEFEQTGKVDSILTMTQIKALLVFRDIYNHETETGMPEVLRYTKLATEMLKQIDTAKLDTE